MGLPFPTQDCNDDLQSLYISRQTMYQYVMFRKKAITDGYEENGMERKSRNIKITTYTS